MKSSKNHHFPRKGIKIKLFEKRRCEKQSILNSGTELDRVWDARLKWINKIMQKQKTKYAGKEEVQ